MASNFQKAERDRNMRLKARGERMYDALIVLINGTGHVGDASAKFWAAVKAGRDLLDEIGPRPDPSTHGHKGVLQPVTDVTTMQRDTREFRGEPVQYRWLTLKCGHLRRVTGLNAAHAKVGDKYRCQECKT